MITSIVETVEETVFYGDLFLNPDVMDLSCFLFNDGLHIFDANDETGQKLTECLDSPNIIRFYGIVQYNGRPYKSYILDPRLEWTRVNSKR